MDKKILQDIDDALWRISKHLGTIEAILMVPILLGALAVLIAVLVLNRMSL